MVELIDKDALVAKIEKIIPSEPYPKTTETLYGAEIYGKREVCFRILDLISTLEVKEVDLDFQRFAKEMDAIFALPSSKTENTEEEPLNWEYAIAKHFFELALSSKK